LSPEQAQAILDLRLHRLTGLEHEKLLGEYKSLIDLIAELLEILGNPDRLMEVIREELEDARDQFGDARRTEILTSKQDLTIADLIDEAPMVVTISDTGYAKTQPLEEYKAQRRGGRGKSASGMKDEDHISHLLVTSSHDTVMLFSNFGKVYWLRVFEIPVGSRASKGRPIVNLLPLAEGEHISALLPLTAPEKTDADSDVDTEVDEAEDVAASSYIFMATANGTVKKTAMEHFARPRSSGLIALKLDETDALVGVAQTSGNDDIMLVSSSGKTIRFKETDVRPMGRTAAGVRGIKLAEEAKVVSLIVPSAEQETAVLMACENGYGKRTMISEFPVYGRGGQGVIGIQVSERNGPVVGATQVEDTDEVILITDMGTLVRTRVSEISCQGRNTQGVTLIRLSNEERLVGVERVVEDDDAEAEAELVDADVETTDTADELQSNPPSSEE
jgi:DNA gyrase subunit A